MRVKLGAVPEEATRLLAEVDDDASGIGVNYADAYLKILKKTLPDGTKVSCKRRGLKLTLKIGERTGEGLMRRLEHGPDVRRILHRALTEAAAGAGAVLTVEDGVVHLDLG